MSSEKAADYDENQPEMQALNRGVPWLIRVSSGLVFGKGQLNI